MCTRTLVVNEIDDFPSRIYPNSLLEVLFLQGQKLEGPGCISSTQKRLSPKIINNHFKSQTGIPCPILGSVGLQRITFVEGRLLANSSKPTLQQELIIPKTSQTTNLLTNKHFHQRNKMEPVNKKNLRRRPMDKQLDRSNGGDSKRRLLHQMLSTQKCILESRVVSAKITDLNNKAVELYSKGDFHNASRFFEEATFLRHGSSYPPSTTSKSVSRRQIETRDSKVSSCTTPTIPPTSSYIYQRMEFDEGVVLYSEAEVIESGDHPLSVQATLLFNAGQARRKLTDVAGATKFYKDALRLFLPNDVEMNELSKYLIYTVHRIIVPILHNLGQLAYRKGNIAEAISFYELALVHCRQLHGFRSLSVAATLNCLGVMNYHSSVKDSDQAIAFLKEALGVQREVLGPKSKEEGTTLNNLGRVYVQREQYDDALVHYDLSLSIRKDCLGKDHIDYAATAFNAGQSLHQKAEFDRAIDLYREFLRVASIRFSKNHRDIAVVLSGIAQIHQERKEFDKALELYEQSLQVGREALGEYHSEVAMLYNRIGNFHFELENFDEALKAYKKGLHIERQVLEKSHPNIIVTLSNIGEILRQKQLHECAIRIYTDAIKLQRIRYGEKSAEVASTLNVIGLIYDQKGNTEMAIKILQKALMIRRATIGSDHLDVGSTLTYLGTIFYRKSMITTALKLFAESLRIRRNKLGKDHRDVSFTMYNIGLCHQLQGNLQEAIDCFQETLRIEKHVLGDDHKDVSMTLFKLGEVYKAKGDFDRALESFREALAIERKTPDQEDPAAIARTINEIGNIHLIQGDVVLMMEAFGEALRIFQQAGLTSESVAVSGELYHFGITCPNAAPAA